MLTRLLPLGALLPLALVLPRLCRETPAEPLAPNRPLAACFPERTLVLVESPGLAELLERGLADPFVQKVLSSGLAARLEEQAGAAPAELLEVLDGYLGRPALPALASLTRHGAALGLSVGRGGLQWALLFAGDDAGLLQEVRKEAFERLEAQYQAPDAFAKPHLSIQGADAWRLGEEVLIATRGALLAASNDERLLEEVLERAGEADAKGLTDLPAYAAALALRKEAQAAPLVLAWADLKRLGTLADLGERDGLRRLRAWPGTPAVQLLLGPWVAAMGSASAWTLCAELAGPELFVRLRAADAAAPGPLDPEGAPPLPPALAQDSDDLVQALLHRDLADAFLRRTELFPTDAIPAFAKAESDLALFFGGGDLAEDVLARVSPWMRVVVRPASFDPDAVPENPLPAAAVVLVLDEPDVLGPMLTSAFQTLFGILNVDRAQNAKPGFLLGMEQVGGVTLSTARLPKPGPEDGVDLAYNLVPACAFSGELFVLATHRSLARELCAEISASATKAAADPKAGEWMLLDGSGLAAVLAENEETLAVQDSLKKGTSIEEARAEQRVLQALVAGLGRVRVGLSRDEGGDVELRLSLNAAEGSSR
jgi:hypothetical protein